VSLAPLPDALDMGGAGEVIAVAWLLEPAVLAGGFAGLPARELGAVALAPGAARVRSKEGLSVAERSFSFLDRVQMFAKPMPQPFLHGNRQLQDKVHKTQGLEDFKIASGIGDDMRSMATKLCKRQRLARLLSKTAPSLRVGKQMIEAIAQDHSHYIKHDLTVAR